jgi:DNA polymerase-1
MKILTIDGNNLVHRVFWVANNIKNVSENYHVYMFLNSVKSYVEMYQPDRVFCVWDEKPDYKPNKRKELLEEYKGNRDKEYGKEVHTKNEIIKEMLQTIGIPSIFPQSYEADDVIKIINDTYDQISKSKFFITKKLFRHIIVTVDRDLCQLISTKVSVYDPIRKMEINESNFEEKLKYSKKDFIKVKALSGDKSDNIPGIKGFGKVKIDKFLNGNIFLSEEENEIYKRNLKLVTLTNDKDEIDYVHKQLNECNHDTDYDMFKTLCGKYKFNKILKDDTKWYTTFFQQNRLLELLS